MPNWSYNNFTISGQKDDLKSFYDEALKPNQNGDLSFKFSNIFPMPERVKNTISPSSSATGKKWINSDKDAIRDNNVSDILGENPTIKLIPCENNTPEKCSELKKLFGADNWYDWNIMNYGTKWDIEVEKDSYEKYEEEFYCYFETAWSPPEIFLRKLQEKFPKLDIVLKYDLEGSDTLGVYETNRYDGEVYLDHSEAEAEYKSEDGRSVHYSNDVGEWVYDDDNEICEDIVKVNPFD